MMNKKNLKWKACEKRIFYSFHNTRRSIQQREGVVH